jgi:glucosamine--fructose-6-phosphate aminotransferase (isomerizing)
MTAASYTRPVKSLGNFPDPFFAEIAGQPDALRRAAAGVADQRGTLSEAARLAGSGNLVLTGMGSSYDACYPAATALAGAGVPAIMVDAAELVYFRLAMIGDGDLLVLTSQSGQSAEVIHAAERLRARHRPPAIVAVTNGTSNRLAELADVVLDSCAGEEEGPSTMTFGASLVMLGAFAKAVIGEPIDGVVEHLGREAADGARAIHDLVDRPELGDRLAAWHGGRPITVVLGRGAARAAAEMAALTLKEAVGMAAESLQAAQFRHGPLELAGPDLAAIIVATEPETVSLDLGLAEDLVRLGSAVLTISSDGRGPERSFCLSVGALDPLVAPAVSVVPAQLLAWRLASLNGREPGAYVHASKVTTRE